VNYDNVQWSNRNDEYLNLKKIRKAPEEKFVSRHGLNKNSET
jgi:hypothetical protein